MYKAFQQWCERILRIPAEPEPPPGDESTARVFRAAPNFFRYLACLWAIVSAVALLVLSIALLGPVGIAITQLQKHGNHSGYLLLFIPALALVLVLYATQRLFSLAVLRLNFEKRWYIVTDRSLRIREGVIGVLEMTITFANIQNISISQGPIQRSLGIADLQVETAGGGGSGEKGAASENLHTGWLRGIDNATEVRDLIQSRIKHLKDAGLGDRDDAHDGSSLPASPDFIAALQEVNFEAQKLARALAPI